jgi:hypothetical protein
MLIPNLHVIIASTKFNKAEFMAKTDYRIYMAKTGYMSLGSVKT